MSANKPEGEEITISETYCGSCGTSLGELATLHEKAAKYDALLSNGLNEDLFWENAKQLQHYNALHPLYKDMLTALQRSLWFIDFHKIGAGTETRAMVLRAIQRAEEGLKGGE